MKRESTSDLMNVLKSSDPEDLNMYMKDHLSKDATDFVSYMDELIDGKQLTRSAIFLSADLPQKYGYKLLTGERHTSDRDKLLRIFIAMNLTLKETQRALELYGMPTLYPKNSRDAVLIIAFNKGIHSVDTVNQWLEEHQQSPLHRSDD